MTHDPEAAGALVRRAMHASFVLLLVVGVTVSLDTASPARVWGAAAAIAVVYAAGIAWQAGRPHRARDRRAGLVWIGALVLVWAASCLVGTGFVWLAFPLFFLVLFVVAAPWSWGLLALLVIWCGVLPLVRHELWFLGGALGPALGACVAAGVHWIVGRLRSDALAKASAQERERLAAEVHDTIAQGLNAIVLLARQNNPALLPEIERTARENLAIARDIVQSGDDGGSVAARVRAACTATERQARALGQSLTVECRIEGAERPLPTDLAQLVVLATGSLLSNVVRHANASRCVLTLGYLPGQLTLDVADDGSGFDPAAAQGYGLRALRRRVASSGGSMDVESAPGEGTTVGIVWDEEDR